MGKLGYTGRLLGHLFAFARQHKVWWIVPLVMLIVFATLVILTSGSAAPMFLYSFF